MTSEKKQEMLQADVEGASSSSSGGDLSSITVAGKEVSKKNQSNASRNKDVVQYLPLIRRVISRLNYRFPPLMEEGDMIAIGAMGLIDALERYEPGALPFPQYAEIRIRGAILDELRRADVLSRGLRKKAKQYKRAETQLRNRLGRHPKLEEIAGFLELPIDEVEEMREQMQPVIFLEVDSLDFNQERQGVAGSFSSRSRQDPQSHFQYREVKQKVLDALEKLPERQRLILFLYYFEEMTLREIGEMLSLSESRICQIHQKACKSVRHHLPFDLSVLSEF